MVGRTARGKKRCMFEVLFARSGMPRRQVSSRRVTQAFVRRASGVARVRAVSPEHAFYR